MYTQWNFVDQVPARDTVPQDLQQDGHLSARWRLLSSQCCRQSRRISLYQCTASDRQETWVTQQVTDTDDSATSVDFAQSPFTPLCRRQNWMHHSTVAQEVFEVSWLLTDRIVCLQLTRVTLLINYRHTTVLQPLHRSACLRGIYLSNILLFAWPCWW